MISRLPDPPPVLEDIEEFYQNEGLSVPFIPESCRDALRQFGSHFWATEEDAADVFSFPQAVAVELIKDPRPFLALGVDGYGTNSWFLHYAYADDQTIVISDIHCGALSRSAEEVSKVVQEQDQSIRRVLQLRDELVGKNLWPGNKRLFVVSSEHREQDAGVGWLRPESPDDTENWQEAVYPILLAETMLEEIN